MPSNSRAMVMYETNVTPFAMEALTDSGDQTIFTSQATEFSEADGYAPEVYPDGVSTGLVGKPSVSLANDSVDVSAGTCYLAGVLTSLLAGTDKTITRPATDVAKVNSVTVTSAGAIAVLPGTDSLSAAFSEVRGGAGGPPLIPVGSIELFQVRVATSAAAPITAGEIFATTGTHRERYDYPGFDIDNDNGQVKFKAALPKIHTGTLPKGVFGSYAEPIYAEQEFANDFKPADASFSVSSNPQYGGATTSTSESLGQASFTAVLKNGVTDDFLKTKGQTIFIKFFQDSLKTPYILTQGKCGISRVFGAADEPKVTVTISATRASVDRAA